MCDTQSLQCLANSIIINIDPTNLFKDEKDQYLHMNDIIKTQFIYKLFNNIFDEGFKKFTSSYSKLNKEEQLTMLETTIEALKWYSNQSQQKKNTQTPLIGPTTRVLSNIIRIAMMFNVIEDNGVGVRLCFNPRETCRHYKRDDMTHCSKFIHLNFNLCSIIINICYNIVERIKN